MSNPCVGGNDAELKQLLNQCVFQWYTPTKTTVNGLYAAEEWAHLNNTLTEKILPDKERMDKYARTCEEQLKETERLINDPGFTDRVGKIIYKAKEKLKDEGVIYYTG